MTETSLEKFQFLLRELFQFDCADLDFGIYRIMNHKRAVIERFIAEDLPQAIAQELARGALAEQGQVQEALAAARQKVLDALGEGALDADGNLAEKYRETKAGKEYLEAQAKAKGARSTEALEAAIYNHLYAFFSRYWQEGDFISKRRYSKKERYAIPYNGEEVYLYWANHDQYYVKTGEYFTDYTYRAPGGVSVHFKLQQADVEQNNVKGEKRFFLPRLDGIAWDKDARTLTIPFEYRPLTAQEVTRYGQKNQQEAIIAQAVTEIPGRVQAAEVLAALINERRRSEKGAPVTWLEHHLRQYTRRNTSDFFIHKDLKGFLSRELDFYLKNEVLNLEELEAAGEGLAKGWFQLMRLIKRVGLAIIEFLAQIEDFQKMLWEKKKFITETFYVITVGNIPPTFYPEIAACEAQWAEWKTLYGIEIPPSPQRGEGRGEGMKSRTKAERSALITQLAREMRQAPTDAENRLWYFVRDRRLGGWKFRRQHPIGCYIVDFVCIERRLIVELDGGQHAGVEQREKDEERTRFLEGRGFRVLRFWNHEVLGNTEGVLETILDALESAPHPNPLPIGERESFLETHPTLPLDTRHFPPDFTDRLLASYENLDEMTDGLLVHSENWQALNLLQEKYRERVKCIYIDPPYNTAASEILYKNNYKHSSWITLMENRMTLGKSVMSLDGTFVIAIDDTEKTVLSALIKVLFPGHDENVVVVNHHPAGAGLEGANISATHEYAIFITPAGKKVLYGRLDNLAQSRIGFMRTGTAESNLRKGRPNSFYAVLVDPTNSKVVGAEPPPCGDSYPKGEAVEGFLRIYPVSEDGTERVWRRSYESFFKELESGNIECVNNKTLYIKSSVSEKHKPIFSNWTDTRYNAGVYGTNILTSIIGAPLFSYPKSLYTVLDCISAVTIRSQSAFVLDHFAGSGTTGHAVINLNREDGGRRKFILVEMAHYFDTVLLPRIKKVTFSPEWRDGKPLTPSLSPEGIGKRTAQGEGNLSWMERSPRIIKVIRLESYEDALNNLTFDDAGGQQALALFKDEYLLSYMLRWETRHSETLLNVEQLQTPFAYQLHLHRDGETRARPVDLPETFAYLLGLDVQTRRVFLSPLRRGAGGEGRYLVYRGTLRNGRAVAIIWRETQGWTADDYQRDADFVAEHQLTAGAEEVYVNGDSRIPGARSLDPIFKERMFAGVEV